VFGILSLLGLRTEFAQQRRSAEKAPALHILVQAMVRNPFSQVSLFDPICQFYQSTLPAGAYLHYYSRTI
jgi:hypothetical protein